MTPWIACQAILLDISGCVLWLLDKFWLQKWRVIQKRRILWIRYIYVEPGRRTEFRYVRYFVFWSWTLKIQGWASNSKRKKRKSCSYILYIKKGKFCSSIAYFLYQKIENYTNEGKKIPFLSQIIKSSSMLCLLKWTNLRFWKVFPFAIILGLENYFYVENSWTNVYLFFRNFTYSFFLSWNSKLTIQNIRRNMRKK